jgi:hypothetical protein
MSSELDTEIRDAFQKLATHEAADVQHRMAAQIDRLVEASDYQVSGSRASLQLWAALDPHSEVPAIQQGQTERSGGTSTGSAITGWSLPIANAFAAATPIFASLAQSADSANGFGPGSVASAILRSGFGIAPLVTGLLKLFGGGSEPEPPPLIKYAAPTAINVHAAQAEGLIGSLDYDQTGTPRLQLPTTPTRGFQSSLQDSPPVNGNAQFGYRHTPAAPGESGHQSVINVNVQAMDSRSFLDHSQEIARAVREAMLNLNAINDVVAEL